MAQEVFEGFRFQNLTETTTIDGTGGTLKGIFVASASNTPTIKVEGGTAVIANTFTPSGPAFYQLPAKWSGDLVVTIGGTVDCTVFYKK